MCCFCMDITKTDLLDITQISYLKLIAPNDFDLLSGAEVIFNAIPRFSDNGCMESTAAWRHDFSGFKYS